MKTGVALQSLAAEIQRQNEAKRDYLADTREMAMLINDGRPQLKLADMEFGITDTAHGQISARLGIPLKYYDKMAEKQLGLLALNVNTWFREQPERRMIRTLDGDARAFLSDSYRRLDNYEIATAVFPMLGDMAQDGAKVESCQITDRKMYIKVVNPKLEAEVKKGDIVQSGIVISNSEVGHGSVSVMPLIYRLVCANGMIAADAGQRRYHTGRTLESDDEYGIYSDETREADDKAFIMKLQDTVRAASDEAVFSKIVERMTEATEARVTSKDIPGVVQLASKQHNLLQSEGESVLDHLIRGGDLSLYGLANAVTRTAQDVESYDRATELEMAGWAMMCMTPQQWKALNAG